MATTNRFGWGGSFARLFLGADVEAPEAKKTEEIVNRQTIVAIDNDDASALVDLTHHYASGYLNQFDMRNQAEVINEYRAMAVHSEVDKAIDDIINEAVTSDAHEPMVQLNIEDSENISKEIRLSMISEFDHIIRLLGFEDRGYEIFRQYYVDGRMYYHKIIDPNNKQKGILKLVNLDPRATKKVKEIITEMDPETRIEKIVDSRSYFLYDPTYISSSGTDVGNRSTLVARSIQQALEIEVSAVAFIHSGILSGDTNGLILSHLEKARKPLNNLRMLEDAAVIYRITRAPERRIFYIDVGSLPKKGAEEYMNQLINRYKTKLVYDGQTGKVKGNSHQISMMEDYWLPRREGGKGTEIDTLAGGENLNHIDDLKYFQKKLLESLNVPKSRLESETTISIGNRATEINRDEIKFNKFIHRLRRKFNNLFLDLLRTQLILKNITTPEDWDNVILPLVTFEYSSDTFIKEEQDAQILEARLAALEQADSFVGKYFSMQTIQKNILRMSEDEIAAEREQIDKEVKEGLYVSANDQVEMDYGIHDDQINAQAKLAKATRPPATNK